MLFFSYNNYKLIFITKLCKLMLEKKLYSGGFSKTINFTPLKFLMVILYNWYCKQILVPNI